MPDIQKTVTDYLSACNAHDATAAAALYAADGTHEDLATKHRREGRAAIAGGLDHFLRALPDARWTEQERIIAGNSAIVLYVLKGHLRGKLGPFPANGQPIELRGAYVFTLNEDGITSTRDFWNSAEFARQASSC